MQTINKSNTRQVVAGVLFPPLVKGGRGIFKAKVAQLVSCTFLTLLTGCAEWNSAPTVVDANYGRAYHNMVKNQTLYPEHGQNDKPILTLDGQKAQTVIKAYRQPAKDPLENAKEPVTINFTNTGGN